MTIDALIIQCYKTVVFIMNYIILPSSCCLYTNINCVKNPIVCRPCVLYLAYKKCTGRVHVCVITIREAAALP